MSIADVTQRDKIPVTLAGRDFVVKVVPMARVRSLASVVAEALKEVETMGKVTDETEGEASKEVDVAALVDKLLQFPYQLLSVFIDGLPPEIFTDEQNGVTFPDFWDVLQIALTINRVDQLKNVFSRLIPMLPNQTSTLPKTS